MISYLGGLLEEIVRFFSAIWDFVLSIGRDLTFLVQLTGSVIVSIPQFFGWLPVSLVSLLLVLLAIVVFYKVLGRD